MSNEDDQQRTSCSCTPSKSALHWHDLYGISPMRIGILGMIQGNRIFVVSRDVPASKTSRTGTALNAYTR